MRRVHILVVGGGITGQLVQFHRPDAEIVDWLPTPSAERRNRDAMIRNWGTNYLWKPLPGLACRRFTVVTHIDGRPATWDAFEAYKRKIGKTSDITEQAMKQQCQETMTGYDFTTLPVPRIHYEHRISQIDWRAQQVFFEKGKEPMQYEHLVSTIPLPALLNLMGWAEPTGGFRNKVIYVRKVMRPPDAPHPLGVVYVNYISDPRIAPYRFCDRLDGERHYESLEPYPDPAHKAIHPGKIYPNAYVPGVLDRLAAVNVTTFGRFGSWDPDELIHDTWDQIVSWKERIAA